MKFLGSAVDINQKKVVQKKVLDKVVLIKTLFVSNQKALDLICYHLAKHIYIVTASGTDQQILKLLLIIYLEILITLYFL